MGNNEPRTINELLRRTVQNRKDIPIVSYKNKKVWTDITGAELLSRIEHIALGLHKLGIVPGDKISIIAESCPEWTMLDFAILSNTAVNVPIYPTQSPDQVEYIINNSEAKILFVSNDRQLKRIQPALDNLNGARPKLILMNGDRDDDDNIMNLLSLENIGREEMKANPDLFGKISNNAQPDDLATIIYTSGTTGIPKGVMLSHRNLAFNALRTSELFDLDERDVGLSFLPLSHVFERIVLYIYLWLGVKIYYAHGAETVAEDIKEVRPTVMSAVPRLFEKIYSVINKRAAEATPLQQKIFHRAIKIGREVAILKDHGKKVPLLLSLEYKLMDRLVFTKWRAAVGGRMRYFVSGGAALSPELAYIFIGAGILILQGYGMTETSPVISFNPTKKNRVGTIGKAIDGVRVRIAEDGEILVQGDNVMQGYYKMPDETAQVLQRYDDGLWIHTGDIGTIDDDGYIRITDRKKDLIKSSLGKYIAPQPIENSIRSIPEVEQVVVIGNGRKYPCALILPSFDALKAYAKSINIDANNKSDLVRHPKLVEFMKKKVDEVTRDLEPHEKIKKIALIDKEFTIDGGELTPTLKVRRKFVEDKYEDLINSLYPKSDS